MNVKILRVIDLYIGSFLSIIFGLFSFPSKKNKFERILVIRLWTLGESVMCLPVIAALKKKFPKAKIDVLATKRSRDVFTLNPKINEVVELGLCLIPMFRKYDLVIDTEPYLRISALASFYLGKRRVGFSHGLRARLYTDRVRFDDNVHTVETMLNLTRAVGADLKPESMGRIYVSREDKRKVDFFLKKNGVKKGDVVVGMCAASAESASETRRWPAENFAKVADMLIDEMNVKVVFVGGPKDKDLNERIIRMMKNKAMNSAGVLNLKQGVELMGRCKIFISNDTGPMHAAAAQGSRVIGLFGPNTPVRYHPYGKGNISFYKAKHPPCIHTHLEIFPDEDVCGGKCLRAITVQEVFEAAKKLLSQR
ncbi:glycosyltransferase family 9 protein [Candidatus Woesearchaeota archaeon]|nr:MAG: glycosyltransferase family 9 protein [Candidatus Woesearchaeota archaeon]